ncbi:DUF4263 domain-containing protein [Salegentibacter sp. BDJ18]|uniref:Shedu anti-phage system protein SduA domain-containing protein n=1 Tax=Salegentibacter sp. BDJ18 TaxID=2816376 RepID=UPI001AAFBF29|nr:Shedu anti-phage system protein SduA domain-containing protein [Salegentibacter sp. BDJ18]MBO2543627.1 DUF4263 domain-containing protein [Salegentibacter sp. BDJ18]
MAKKYFKTPLEKLRTKISRITKEPEIEENDNIIRVRGTKFFSYTSQQIKYNNKRYYPSKVDDIIEEYFKVRIPINHENLNILGSNIINPPFGARKIIDLFRNFNTQPYNSIVIGYRENKITGNTIFITKELYDTILNIDKEEGKGKKARFTARIAPFLNSEYNLSVSQDEVGRNYSLLLKEMIASGELKSSDLINLSDKLDSGETNQIIIEKQVNKQVRWLIDTIEDLLEDSALTTPKAKNFGFLNFGYSKSSITGPEHLIEKVLSDYGQYTLFGVPALLNTDKYVINPGSQSRSQFDLILITHLGDVEVVELKRTDETILDYEKGRDKFYPSKNLSIAIAQAERYISAVQKDNDEEYLIEGKKIREYINEQIGGTTYVESIRPTALILIGSWKTLTKDYENLSAERKRKVSEIDYNENGLRAYREIKNSYRNIKIMNYSELLEHARTRLEIMKSE